MSFGNSLYTVTFEKRELPPPRFGAKYTFYLTDAVENVPEYLVNTDVLVGYAFVLLLFLL